MGPTTPIIQVPGRTFPVTPYFLEDAVELSNYRLEPDSDSPYVERHSRELALSCALHRDADDRVFRLPGQIPR